MLQRRPQPADSGIQCDVVSSKTTLSLSGSKSVPQLAGQLVLGGTVSTPVTGQEVLRQSISQPGIDKVTNDLLGRESISEEQGDDDGENGDTSTSVSKSTFMLRKAVKQVRDGHLRKSSLVEDRQRSLRPSLESFQQERVMLQDLSNTSSDFFGEAFFKDDWFPDWLTDRNDFLMFCPRYCQDQGRFDQIADHIPRTYMVVRAMKNSKWGDKMDMPQIRHLARKARVMDFPRGTTIFRQGDVADALYIVVKGQVSLRIKQTQEAEKRSTSPRSPRATDGGGGRSANSRTGSIMSKKLGGKDYRQMPPASSFKELEVAIAKESDVFGEVGLESMSTASGQSRRRAASAYCVDPTIVARIPAEAYKVELKSIQSESTRRLCEWFQAGKCQLINHLSRHGQIILAKKVRSEIFTPDTTIYQQGAVAHAIYLVRRGHCVAKKTLDFKQQIRSDVNGIESKGLKFSQDADLIEFKEGDYFGEEFLVDRKDRAMRVVATRGGAELIVILNAVAEELFKEEAMPAVWERWNDVMLKVRQNQAECLNNIQSQQVRRDVRKNCFGPIYQRRAHMVSDRCMDTVQQLLDEDSQRQIKLKHAYEKVIGQIDVPEVSVKELKRREELGKRRPLATRISKREKEDAEERRSSLSSMSLESISPKSKRSSTKEEPMKGDIYQELQKQKDTMWLRKHRRKLQNASDKESLEEKQELHEEVTDDVRCRYDKIVTENEEHLRTCVQLLDKNLAFRDQKAAMEKKKLETVEESSSETSEQEIVDVLVANEQQESEASSDTEK